MVTIVVWFDRQITVGGMAVAADTSHRTIEKRKRVVIAISQAFPPAPGHQ